MLGDVGNVECHICNEVFQYKCQLTRHSVTLYEFILTQIVVNVDTETIVNYI